MNASTLLLPNINQLLNRHPRPAMDAVQRAKLPAIPGAPRALADMATLLFTRQSQIRCPANPDWPDRDRSCCRMAMLHAPLSLLYLSGSPDMTIDELKNFPSARQPHNRGSRIWPRRRGRDHHRTAGQGIRPILPWAMALARTA